MRAHRCTSTHLRSIGLFNHLGSIEHAPTGDTDHLGATFMRTKAIEAIVGSILGINSVFRVLFMLLLRVDKQFGTNRTKSILQLLPMVLDLDMEQEKLVSLTQVSSLDLQIIESKVVSMILEQNQNL